MAVLEATTRTKQERKAADAVIATLAARYGNRLVTSHAVREQHGHTTTWIENQPPDAVVFPQTTEEVQEVVRLRRRGARAGGRLRRRHLARRPGQRAARRHLPRFPRHEPRARGPCRGPRLRHRARHHAQAAQRISARQGSVLPDRSRRRRLARRHGGDARVGHQCGALRHHEGQCAGAQSRARQRRGDLHRAAGEKVSGGLRPHAAPDRLRRHARHHHRIDVAAVRDSRSDFVRRLPVPERRGGVQCDDPDHPVRHPGGAHRTARRTAGARRATSIPS